MKFAHTQKTPVAVLGGLRDEGLNPTPTKEQNMHQSTVPTRLDFEGLVIDVDPSAAAIEHVEITFSTRWTDQEPRTTYGIALTPTEARKLASALLDAAAPDFGSAPVEEIEEHVAVARKVPVEIPVSDLAAGTVTDVFRFATEHDMSPGDVMRAVETYIDGMAEVESLTPAKWCKRQRQLKQGALA
jgi:hypothetical protein